MHPVPEIHMDRSRSARLQAAVDQLVALVSEVRESERIDHGQLLLGDLVRRERETWGMTIAQLADRVGHSKAYLGQIERHRSVNPSVRLIVRLAETLGIPVIRLVEASIQSQRLREAQPTSETLDPEGER
jgi:ribosome-binding protein aMBF1 (putative translation factor)